MVVKKRKKNVKFRGSKTHGWGSMKKHRGAGNKGGRGRAGSGKRGDAKKPSNWKNNKYFGKHGFKNKGVKEKIKAINILYLEQKFDKLLNKKLITDEKGVYSLDMSKLGFNKLIGSGKVTRKYKIQTKYASKKAIEKIKKNGGEIITQKITKEVKEEKQN